MIAFLRGNVAAVYDGAAVIDVGGVGYEVRIAGETVQRLAAAGRDEEVKVYTYTYLREDQIALYGFTSREDLELFKLLITVSGIGPKGGLALLSVGTADDLRFAIMTGDAKMIARAPGVGKKTAERVILDLRDKVAGMRDAQMLAIAADAAAASSRPGPERAAQSRARPRKRWKLSQPLATQERRPQRPCAPARKMRQKMVLPLPIRRVFSRRRSDICDEAG